MKKAPLFLVISLLMCSLIYSQEIKIGVKGGFNLNQIGELYHYGNDSGLGINVTPNEDTVYSGEHDIGTQLGIFVMINFDRFYLRPELNFVSLKNAYALANNTVDWTANKIDIPILFGYEIYKPISVYAGPIFSSISNLKLEGLDYGTIISYNKSSIGFGAGILMEFDILGIDVRYQYAFTEEKTQRIDMNRSSSGTNIADLKSYNPSQIMVSIHINILNLSNRKSKKGLRSGWRNHKNL